jgi:hypothetical protein
MMIKTLATAIVIAALTVTTAAAATVQYEFSGRLFWTLPVSSSYHPKDPGVIEFSGTAFFDNDLTDVTDTVSFNVFDTLRIGDPAGVFTDFSIFNVGANLTTSGLPPIEFIIGGAIGADSAAAIAGDTNDFLATFVLDSPTPFDFGSSPPVSFELTLDAIFLSNIGLAGVAGPSEIAGGSILFTRQDPTVIPVPAAASLFLAGLAAFGFASRRWKTRAV